MNLWEKVGNIRELGNINILFRSSGDHPKIDISNNSILDVINNFSKLIIIKSPH